MKVDIPVFIAHGTADRSVPIESLDFLQAQALLHRKNNLHFNRYPGLTHGFRLTGDKDSNDSQTMCNKVYGDFFTWLKAQ